MTAGQRNALIALGGVLVLAGALYASLFTLGVLPRLGFAPGYVLVDPQGALVTSEDLRGSVVVYTFTTPWAQHPHRDSDAVMAQLRDLLAGYDGEIPVRLVSIVLASDAVAGAEGARAAATRARADGERWRFVSGRPTELRVLMRDGFGMWYEHDAQVSIRYDPAFVVVDGFRIVRSVHRVGMPGADDLARDVRSIVREASAATGAARLAYAAAHLFQCYPSR